MKQIIFFKKILALLVFIFIWNTELTAQTPSCYGAHFVSPGNNSCNAGMIAGSGCGASFSFPIPTGLTLSQLNYLGTDYSDLTGGGGPDMHFNVTVQCSGGQESLYFGIPVSNDPIWNNTGNLATGNRFTDMQAAYGSCLVSSIIIHAFYTYGSAGEDFAGFDNTIINNRLYNYDDCDGDGLLDIFDCAPNNNGNNKVLVCHSGNTICVAQPALQAHLNHGDFMGSCSANARPANNLPPEEVSINEIKLYPNPATNQISIRNNYNKMLGTVSIYDISGKMVYKNNFIGSFQAIIDVKNFASGVYYLRSDQMEKRIKFVKQ